MPKSKPKPCPNFATFHRDRRKTFADRVLFAQAQTEAAHALLARAESLGLETEFWVCALAFAEGEETAAHRSLARFDARDFEVDRQNFDYSAALQGRAESDFLALKRRRTSEARLRTRARVLDALRKHFPLGARAGEWQIKCDQRKICRSSHFYRILDELKDLGEVETRGGVYFKSEK